MGDLDDVRELGGGGAWRQQEAWELSDLVQNRFRYLQVRGRRGNRNEDTLGGETRAARAHLLYVI